MGSDHSVAMNRPKLLTIDIVFDVVYMNQTSLTRHPLNERRSVLHRIINPVERRFEIHKFSKANAVQDIETELRKIVAEGYNVPRFSLTITDQKVLLSRSVPYGSEELTQNLGPK